MARAKNKKRRWPRVLMFLAVLAPVLVLALWFAIHRIPWLGPLLADTARSIVGPGPIAKAEDLTYGAEDRWNRFWREDEQPEAYWQIPQPAVPAPPPSASPAALPPFQLANVPPVHQSWSAPGDGVWVPVPDPAKPNEPKMLKTLLHPDRNRSWSAVTVVAADMRRVRLHLVAGRYEPKATEREGLAYKRTGLVPETDHDVLLAAFNGGFKLEHGHYGMRVDGVTLVKPRKKVCTIAMHRNDRLEIGSWERFGDRHEELLWWRQTPHCMWEGGKMHGNLRAPDATHWGATVDGDTVIRRSAIGVSEDSSVLFVGIGESTTAQSIAVAMEHAGAHEVAQLDVNWSFPKFLTFARRDAVGELVAEAICKGFEFDEGDFVRKPYARDFFYLTRKSEAEIASAAGGP